MEVNAINSKKFKFDIYLKHTYTDLIISALSIHPNNIKVLKFHAMLDWLIKVPLNQENYKINIK